MEKWLAVVIRLVLERISPEIAVLIRTSLAEAKIRAHATNNPYDDILVDILIFLTGG